MGTVNNSINTSNFQSNDFDQSKVFIWDNRYSKATFLNNTGDVASFPVGTVLARKSDSNQIVALDASVDADAQNIPIGILAQEITELADAGTVDDINFVTKGDVAAEKIALVNVADTFQTVIAEANDRTIEDLLLLLDIRLIESEELTDFDNS